MNNLGTTGEESNDIVLEQEQVEVNETPGVQMGGFYDINQNPLVKYFLEHSSDLTTKLIGNGFVLDDMTNQKVEIQFNFDSVKNNITIFVPPIGFYFNDQGQIPASYTEYVSSLPNSQSYKKWFGRTGKAEIKHQKNIFDKLIYDLLYFTQKEMTNNNIENVKAFISITSRMYVLIVGGFFLDMTAAETQNILRNQNGPLLTDKYDLFNALQILRGTGMFGANSWLLTANAVFDTNIPITPAFPWGPNYANLFKLNGLTKIICSYDPNLLNIINSAPVGQELPYQNYVFYFSEYIYQWHSTLLYTLFKVNEKPDSDEVKTYSEFRTTKDFLIKMPEIIDQAFKTQAVSKARATVGDPVLDIDAFTKGVLDILMEGKKQTDIDAAPAPNTVTNPLKVKFDFLLGLLARSKDAIVEAPPAQGAPPEQQQKYREKQQAITEAGFDKAKFATIQAKFDSAGGAGPTANLDDVKSLITTQKYYDVIKDLAQKLKGLMDRLPQLETAATNARTAFNDAERTKDEKQAAVNRAAAAVTQAQRDELAQAETALDAAKTAKEAAEKPINDLTALQTQILNLVQSLEKTRITEPPLNQEPMKTALEKIYTFAADPPNITTKINEINAARNAFLQVDHRAPAVDDANVVNRATALNVFNTYKLKFTGPAVPANPGPPPVAAVPPDSLGQLFAKYNEYKDLIKPESKAYSETLFKRISGIIDQLNTTVPFNAAAAAAEDKIKEKFLDAAAFDRLPDINAKKAELTKSLTAVEGQIVALKKLLTDSIPAAGSNPTAPAVKTLQSNFLDNTNAIPKGALRDPPTLNSAGIAGEVLANLLSATSKKGGSKRSTRRNRNRKNAMTRRNNDMSY